MVNTDVNFPDQIKPHPAFAVKKLLNYGFVRLIDVMPSPTDQYPISADDAIVQAARVSYGKGTKSVSENKSLIHYLIKNKHTSPLEMVEFKFHCRMPIFIARQWIRHRTANVNEYSARYSEVPDIYYIPEIENIKGQSLSNKQGSDGEISFNDKEDFIKSLDSLSRESYDLYKKFLDKGVSRETARMMLPISYYTEWYWKMDLNNLFHFIKLRNDNHAQYEIRIYAEAIYDIVKQIAPISCEAFEEYVKNSILISSLEKECLHLILNERYTIEEASDKVSSSRNLSKRKKEELLSTIKNILQE